MNADQLSYKRATSISLLGLGTQAVLAAVVLIYSRMGQDQAAFTASIAMLLRAADLGTLAIIFYQHKLERVEALEAEMYAASSAADASVFEESSSDMNVQAAKVAWLHKWFTPIVSVIVGASFMGIGFWRFIGRELMSSETIYEAPPETGWAIAIGVGVAAISFVFARFVAGMAKQNVWMLLHAGSATSVLAALFGGGLALAHFLHAAINKDGLLEILPAVYSVSMIALGAEIFLNLILNLYRPRTADQMIRPAFDSRVLAYVAAPDRLAKSVSDAINYQFGFNVSSTWFYRLLSRTIIALVVLGAGLIWAMSAVVIVEPGERGVLLANGRFVREVEPGPVLKAPWALSEVVTFPADTVNEFVVGEKVEAEGAILWNKSHGEEPMFVIVQPTESQADADSRTSLSLLIAEIPVHYVVRPGELRNYLDLAQDGPREEPDRHRRNLLRSVASRVVIEQLSTITVDEAVGPQRNEIASQLYASIQERFNDLESGVEVTFVGIAGLHPEESVAPSFEKLVGADQKRQAAIERAEAIATDELATVAGELEKAEEIIRALDSLQTLERSNAAQAQITRQEQAIMDLILDAGGEAASLIAEAKADRWERHMNARARFASSTGQIAMYRAAPAPYLMTQLAVAYRQTFDNSRLYISPFEMRLEINQEEEQAAISGFTEALEYEPGQEQE